jgi:hypothetical protein
MKKNIFLTVSLLAIHFLGFSQMPKWCIPPYLVDVSGAPSITVNNLQTSTYLHSANGAYDKNGSMLFYVVDGTAYLPNGTSTFISVANQSSYGICTETGVIGVPGYCNRFYIIAINSYPSAGVNLYYSMVEVNPAGNVSVVAGFNNVNLGAVGGEYASFAISKLRPDKTRFLFTLGRSNPTNPSYFGSANKFLITSSGISFQSEVFNIYSLQTNNKPWEAELYENPVSGEMKLAWGDSYTTSTAQYVFVLNLDNNGNYVSTQSVPISGLTRIYGLEFFDNGSKLFVSQVNSTATNTGIAVADLALNTTSFIPNSQNYLSQIEKAKNGNYYVLSTSKDLAAIDPSTLSITSVLNLPNLATHWFERTLPDQVDDEDYSNANYRADLTVRDAVTDIGLEPNPSDDVWVSPDLWNRRDGTGNPNDNQNPGYAGGGNLMNVRVKNRGCVASQPSYVKLYWTLGATQERWPASWNGTTLINNKVAGEEIKTSGLGYADYITINGVDKGYEIPALQPGQEIVITAKWYPPDPGDYNDPSRIGPNAMICFLARIDDPNQDPMFSELSSNTASTGRNIKYNNNIATRNSYLTNMEGSYMVVQTGGTILIGNYLDQATLFNVRFRAITPNDIEFGTIGKVTLKMDEKLWDAWMDAGGEGEGVEINDYENHDVRITNMENAILKNINISAGEFMGIGSYFELTSATDVEQTYSFVISQEKTVPADNEESYGSECVFMVSINGEGSDGSADDGNGTAPAGPAQPISKVINLNVSNQVELFPNPNTGVSHLKFNMVEEGDVSVQVLDLSGRVLKTIVDTKRMSGGVHNINVSSEGLTNGTYMLQIVTSKVYITMKMSVMR